MTLGPGRSGSLTDGLLDRRRPRRRRQPGSRWLVLALALGAALWVRSALVNGGGTEAEGAAMPTDRILALRAPEIRGFGASADDGGGVEFDVALATGPSFPTYVEGAIEPGQSLTAAVVSRGVPADSLHPVIASLGEIVDFRRSQIGDRFEVELTSEGEITSLRYQRSPEIVYEARLASADGYESRQVEVPLEVEPVVVAGSVEGSFYASVAAIGESEALAQQVVSVFQWDIDFSRDVRPGDAFRILFERVYLEGQFLRYGDVLAAEYEGSRVSHAAYYFDDPEHEGYYTAEGASLERMFLAAPCRYRRISSRFDLERMHPVMNRRAPHVGVDYAADTGTPVWAAADGVVSHVGYNARAGNMVKVRHADEYETVYAHLSRFAARLRPGDRVEQGDVIGFVGSTGMSTGPHLHYGLKHRGEYIDPLGRDWSRGRSLSGRALRDFQRRQSQLAARLAEVPMPAVTAEPETGEEQPELHLDLPFDSDVFGIDTVDDY